MAKLDDYGGNSYGGRTRFKRGGESKPWSVVCLSERGDLLTLLKSKTRQLCYDFINDAYGPVELAR